MKLMRKRSDQITVYNVLWFWQNQTGILHAAQLGCHHVRYTPDSFQGA